MDGSWSGYFSMLKYNAEQYGKKFARIKQYESTSQKCHKCGYMNKRIKELSNREWGCMQCQIREMLIQYFHVPC
ncbi:zinc ribbon domain-containing protein [Coprobacillus cateniformis]|uniref:zinc ribbon domain-containing protein n=2 Tax=Coprobacillus cateniformis TaxID=100884 RepID=UPI003B8A89C9